MNAYLYVVVTYIFAIPYKTRLFCSKKKQMGKKIKALISDSSVNSYGFRVLTEGIDLSQYKRNPLLLWMHRRATFGTKEEVLPLGIVEDLEVKDGALYGVPVISSVDEFSGNILKLWEEGTVKMVSARFDDPVFSVEPQYLMPDQLGATVIKCKLTEVSIVDIGANDNALQLFSKGKALMLSNDGACDIPLINNTKNMNEIQSIALALGLEATATLGDCVKQIAVLLSFKKKSDDLQVENDSIKLASITNMVQGAIDSKRIKAEQKEHFVALGKAMGADSLKVTLDAIPVVATVKPSGIIGGGVQLGNNKEYAKLSEVPHAELVALKKDDPDTYKKLYKAEYGFECEL